MERMPFRDMSVFKKLSEPHELGTVYTVHAVRGRHAVPLEHGDAGS